MQDSSLEPWVPVVGPGVAAEIQVSEGSEGAVHAASEPERPVPQVVPASLVQHDHVHQAPVEAEQQVQGDVTAWQVVHADQPRVFTPDLQQLQATFLCSLQKANLSERPWEESLFSYNSY